MRRLVVIAVVGALLPVCLKAGLTFVSSEMSPNEQERRAACQTNLKEIALAFAMYVTDYDAKLPTWATYRGKRAPGVPSPTAVNFRTLRGKLPPGPRDPKTTWPMRLHSQLKNVDVIWCPSDPNPSESPNAKVSYHLKRVVDYNYAGGYPKSVWAEGDFNFPSEQILFYERASFHWGGGRLGNGAAANAAFFDGHVKTTRFKDVGLNQEPDFYNWDAVANQPAPKGASDPRRYCDMLN